MSLVWSHDVGRLIRQLSAIVLPVLRRLSDYMWFAQYVRQARGADPDVTCVIVGDQGVIPGTHQHIVKCVIFKIGELSDSESRQHGFPPPHSAKALVRVSCRFQRQRGHLDPAGNFYC